MERGDQQMRETITRQRHWAEQRLKVLFERRTELTAELEDATREIEKLTSFLEILDKSRAAVERATSPAPLALPLAERNGGSSRAGVPHSGALGDLIADILHKAEGQSLTPKEIAHRAAARGFRPEGQKANIKAMIANEVARLARYQRRGIVRISDGRYTVHR